MSDSGDIFMSCDSGGSDADFSASEDEWRPTISKKKKKSSSSESSSDSDYLDDEDLVPKFNKKKKYDPKTSLTKLNQSLVNKNNSKRKAANLKNKKQPIQKSKKLKKDDSDSSSGDEYLVNPKDIDLTSVFFNILPKEMIATKSNNVPPTISKTQEQSLSLDSIDEDEAGGSSTNQNDFGNYQQFTKNLELAKDHLKQFNAKSFIGEESSADHNLDDVKQLLALGEMIENPKSNVDQEEFIDDSDNDWEEVEEKTNEFGKKDVEVAISSGNKILKNTNRLSYFEYLLKNQLNKRKRKYQQILHKVNLLCLIGYGNMVNATINHPKLLQMCRTSLIPEFKAPKKGTKINQKYIGELLKLYRKNMQLKDTRMYPRLKKLPSLATSLAIQIEHKEAICIRDFILIFIIFLRANSIQCRYVMNLATVPIRPLNSELSALKLDSSEALCNLLKNDGKLQTKRDTLNINNMSHWSKIVELLLDDKGKMAKELSALKGTTNTVKNTKTSAVSKEKIAFESKIKKVPRIILTDIMKTKKQLPVINNERDNKISDSKPLANEEQSIEILDTKIAENRKRKRVSFKIHSDDSEIPAQKIKPNNDKSSDRLTRQKALKNIQNVSDEPTKKPKLSTTNSKQSKKTDENSSLNVVTTKRETRSSSAAAVPEENNKKPTTRKKPLQSIPQLDGGNDNLIKSPIKRTRSKNVIQKKKIVESSESDADSDFEPSAIEKSKRAKNDSDFEPSTSKKKPENVKTVQQQQKSEPISKGATKSKAKKCANRSLKSKSENSNKSAANSLKTDIWIEIFCESKWMPMDVLKKTNSTKIDDIRKNATKPITYVFAWNNNETIRDVTTRYCSHWNQISRTKRVAQEWLDIALARYLDDSTESNEREENELNEITLHKPLPKVISEYKNHPLYVLKRHLLKFEVLYPENPLTLGFIRNEAVYSRDCVHVCKSRKVWLREARVVKPGEKAYKVVMDRPKWDAATRTILKPLPMDIFGLWQTQPYEPPVAENGIVPRNEYGNVEIFKPEMVPKNTVHITLPGINRTCRKLGVDCAPAFIGYDWSTFKDNYKSPQPFDGYIICKEFEEKVIKQYYEDQMETERKDEEKRNQRIYGNWKKLIKGLFIRERLQRKYDFKK